MRDIGYVKFSDMKASDFIPVLNEEAVRHHLVEHPLFDEGSIQQWVDDKIQCDGMPGCRVRAVYVQSQLIGWCGIQQEEDHFEIAIVISQSAWGAGHQIFKQLMAWAQAFGHQEVTIHLLESRRSYKFLERRSSRTTHTSMLGRHFVTYYLPVKVPV